MDSHIVAAFRKFEQDNRAAHPMLYHLTRGGYSKQTNEVKAFLLNSFYKPCFEIIRASMKEPFYKDSKGFYVKRDPSIVYSGLVGGHKNNLSKEIKDELFKHFQAVCEYAPDVINRSGNSGEVNYSDLFYEQDRIVSQAYRRRTPVEES